MLENVESFTFIMPAMFSVDVPEISPAPASKFSVRSLDSVVTVST